MKQCHSVAAHFPKIQKRKNSSFFFFKLRKQVVNILERSVHFQKYKFKWYPKKNHNFIHKQKNTGLFKF